MHTLDKKEKKRDRALILLLLLLLYIGGTMYYYGLSPAGEGMHVKKLPADKPANTNNEFIVTMGTDTLSLDSGAVTREEAMRPDTAEGATTSQALPTAKAEEPVAEPAPGDVAASDVVNELRNNKELIDISPDDDMVCLFDPTSKNLHFYPSKSEWGNVYLVYPSPDYKSLLRRNLIYPNYPGAIYPVYKKGKATYNGKTNEAVAVKINASAGKTRSYVIRAKSAPDYFVFGDYQNKDRWYIYEDGKVRKFSPPENFDSDIKDNLK